jgi:site-specific recombinase XerD
MATKIKTRHDKDGKPRYLALYSTPDGRWLSAGTRGDRKLAEKAAYAAEKKAESGAWVDPRSGKVTLGAYVESTYKTAIKAREATTRDAYLLLLDKHIVPAFGDRALDSIRPSDVQTWMSGLLKGGLSNTTVTKAKSVLNQIFTWAVRDRLIESSPCALVSNLPTPSPTVKIMTPEQFDLIVDNVKGETNKAFLLTAIGTGMRWSEVVGLAPRQIDFLNRKITVDRALVCVVKRNNGGESHLRKRPKSNRTRVIPVDDDVLTALSIEIKKRGLGAQSDEEVFHTASRGRVYENANFRADVWLPANKAAGLESYGYCIKHLRSSFCSWLLAGGADLGTVQKLMGHSNIQTTQKYIQTLPEAMDKARDVLTAVRTRGRTEATVTPLRSSQ